MPNANDIVKTSSDIENVEWNNGQTNYSANVRYGSSSSQASQNSGDICRICHCESDPQNPLLTPCYCSGSLKYVHQTCLQQWLTASEINACELCKFPFIMHTKIKPFNEWRSLEMSGVERRRLCCAVLFHCAGALCVIWSLCILIERAAEEVKRGLIGWPFWTKLAVVTVGLTGGVVFMYIQCRQYLHLCHRWRARNRILLIQNAPEKIHPLTQGSPIMHSRNMPRNSSTSGVGSYSTASGCNNGFNYNIYGYAANHDIDSTNNSVQFGQTNQNIMEGSLFEKHNYANMPLHGKIVANIENYNRDYGIDDNNQIPTVSFRQCPPGSSTTTSTSVQYNDVMSHKAAAISLSEFHSNQNSNSKLDLNVIPNQSSSSCSSASTNSPNNKQTNDLNLFNIKVSPTTSTANTCASSNIQITERPSKPTPLNPLVTDICNKRAINSKYPNSSVFLENRDILNDDDRYPKINYRHSSVLTSPDIADNLDKFLGKDCRRYSDTKLLQNDPTDLISPIFNVALNDTNQCDDLRYQKCHKKDKSVRNISSSGAGTGNILTAATTNFTNGDQKLTQNVLGVPQITDIIFENTTQIDPLELNIQEILDMDSYQFKRTKNKKLRSSLNHFVASKMSLDLNDSRINCDNELQQTTETIGQNAQQIDEQQMTDKSRSLFKSLPNLSSSCESLIKK